MKLRIKKCDVRDLTGRESFDLRRTSSRVYVWIENDKRDKPVLDILTGFRYNKPHQIYKEQVIPAVLKKMGVPANSKVRWSQYAGCSCPCSPGFIVSHPGFKPKDVFVSVFKEQPELFETE